MCVKDCTSKTGRAGVCIMPPEYPAMLQTSVCVVLVKRVTHTCLSVFSCSLLLSPMVVSN